MFCVLLLALLTLCAIAYLYWRYVWFFRNPARKIPSEGSGILSPADGSIVYVKEVAPGEETITIKQGVKATVDDICREAVSAPKVLIGIFMSPFNVHYNRVPLSGTALFIRHYPALGKNLYMAAMHLRTVFRRLPLYRNSLHIIQNERTVTGIKGLYRGRLLNCYVVQIAAKSVNGIDSYIEPQQRVSAGQILGMIRIGSQVDLIVTAFEGMKIRVRPGDRVRAGETILIE
ncbi:MAG TPA: phosphatidylserine decarboxylase [Deltaproteobacteria bacterium]|jgi:phosphatidylserine decarboxylase|nr:phosphatidylserine decarboxylase [Deltaproteobacteria bacterium]